MQSHGNEKMDVTPPRVCNEWPDARLSTRINLGPRLNKGLLEKKWRTATWKKDFHACHFDYMMFEMNVIWYRLFSHGFGEQSWILTSGKFQLWGSRIFFSISSMKYHIISKFHIFLRATSNHRFKHFLCFLLCHLNTEEALIMVKPLVHHTGGEHVSLFSLQFKVASKALKNMAQS
jgi:hypothetical protein